MLWPLFSNVPRTCRRQKIVILTDESVLLIPRKAFPRITRHAVLLSSRKSDPQHTQTPVHVRRRRLFAPDCFMQSPRDRRLNASLLFHLCSRKGVCKTCGFLTRLLSIRIGLRLGSKIRASGSMLTGLCRFPSLHSFQSGLRTPQKSTPVQSRSSQ